MSSKKLQKEIKKITRQIAENYKPEKIILFGSCAYGKPNENSDIDLLVIKETKEKFGSRLFKVCKYIDSPMGTDVLVYTPKEWESGIRKKYYFLKEIKNKGKLVYEKSK